MAECEFCDGSACKCDKQIKVSFCPECKSRDVKYVFGVKNLFGVIPKMKCGKCGLEMPSFPLLVTSKKLLAASDKGKAKKKKSGRKKK
ncbi:hypothetical protein HN935_02600 [archaeon]|jgi:hypothetical protein|nr:hypothetical protein [archaeon]